MKYFGHIANIGMMVAALLLALTVTVAVASATSADEVHVAPAVEHAPADAAHGAAAGVQGEGEAHGAAAAAHGGGSLSTEKLKDLLWRILNFIVLMFLLVKFGAKPIASVLSGRQKRIRDELEDLQHRRNEAERQYREFEAKLASVEQDIDTIVEKAVAQAEIEKNKIIEKAEKAVDDMKRQAELAIHNEVVEARRALKNEMAEQAAVMAEELIVKNLKPEDQVQIIENYLNKVGAVQ